MAGIGIQLNKIFDKNTLRSSIHGVGFSIINTIMPMLIVIATLLGMYKALGFQTVGYVDRQLFTSSILYIFIFSLLAFSPFSTVLSKYMSDKIYERRYEDIKPCMYIGITIHLTFASLIAVPFYLYAIFVGKIPVHFVFTSYMAFLGLSLTLSTMLYNFILKQYKKISLYYTVSMIFAFVLSVIFKFILNFSVTYSMLLAISFGFLTIASLLLVNFLRYFPENSYRYMDAVKYYSKYWKLISANFLYTLGLFTHNFVFWTKPWHLVVYNTYVSNETYDMASFLAMFTNLSATVFFITRVEMKFREKYKTYNEAIIGGKLKTIKNCEERMFDGLGSQIFSLVNLQFMISIIIFFIAILIFPRIGFSGLIMDIYPQLAIAYYISSLMYAELIFLYYFDDLTGALLNGAIYVTVTLIATMFTSNLTPLWYGTGFGIGALSAFTFSYFRLRWISQNIDKLIFHKGSIIKSIYKDIPDALVYDKRL